jgi:membrane protease YdiL (CAAX protease family)
MSVVPPARGGRWGKAALVAQVCFLGLLWAWVANTTGSILWTALAHILIDFSALGWGVLFTATTSSDEALTARGDATGGGTG